MSKVMLLVVLYGGLSIAALLLVLIHAAKLVALAQTPMKPRPN